MSNGGISISNLIRTISVFLATGFGSGYAPKAPGTFGTLVAVPLYLFMQPLPLPWYLFITVFVSLSGIWICRQADQHFGGHDNQRIVWDEIAGYLITMAMAPSGWGWVLAGFLLFRFFDILKPWPVSWADKKVQGGLGVMLDDIIAGGYALLCMVLLEYFFNLSV